MAKIRMEIELDYDEGVMHGGDPEAIQWFYMDILGGADTLTLHSGEIGDEVGAVKFIKIID